MKQVKIENTHTEKCVVCGKLCYPYKYGGNGALCYKCANGIPDPR